MAESTDLRGGTERSPLAFFALTTALAAPFLAAGAFVDVPGLPKNAPATDFIAAFMPALAAVILTYRAEGAAGAARLLRRVLDLRRIARRPGWIAAVALLPPAVYGATAVLIEATGVEFVRQPALSATTMLVFAAVFVAAAAGEELGWTGYVTEPLVRRWGALGGALLLGAVHWALHVPSILISGQDATLILLGVVFTLALRVVWVWMFASTGSVAAVILSHAVVNMCASYVPSVPTSAAAPVLALVAAAVVVGWGARTLSEPRWRRAR